MNWGPFFAWVVVLLGLFVVSIWPVTPKLDGKCGNVWAAKNLWYYGILFFHYFLGVLTLAFLLIGLFRDLLFGNFGDDRQLTFLLSYSFLVASFFTILLVHRFCPLEKEEDKEIVNANENEDIENRAEVNTVEDII